MLDLRLDDEGVSKQNIDFDNDGFESNVLNIVKKKKKSINIVMIFILLW